MVRRPQSAVPETSVPVSPANVPRRGGRRAIEALRFGRWPSHRSVSSGRRPAPFLRSPGCRRARDARPV